MRYQILDTYLGVTNTNRSNQFYKTFKPNFDKTVKNVKGMQARVKRVINLHLHLKNYTGNYTNELYGPINIIRDGDELLVHLNNSKNLIAKLQYMDNDEWLINV